jgi:hypothetical protein
MTLSYVWGSVDISATLKNNIGLRRQPRSIKNIKLPKTIQDAIKLVAGIEERYL